MRLLQETKTGTRVLGPTTACACTSEGGIALVSVRADGPDILTGSPGPHVPVKAFLQSCRLVICGHE